MGVGNIFGENSAQWGDLLKNAVEKQTFVGSVGLREEESVSFAEVFDPEKTGSGIWNVGRETTNAKHDDAQFIKDVRLSEFKFADFRKFLQIRQRGEDFFTHENKKQSGIK